MVAEEGSDAGAKALAKALARIKTDDTLTWVSFITDTTWRGSSLCSYGAPLR